MKIYESRHGLMLLFCWLYIGIGLISAGLGAYMLHLQHVLGSQAMPGVQLIAGVLIVFGPIRAVNSIRVMYKIKRSGNHKSVSRN